MALRLAIDNTKNKNSIPTCRNNCELFDPLSEQCGIHNNINPDNPTLIFRCGDVIYKEQKDVFVNYSLPANTDLRNTSLHEDEFESECCDESTFFEIMGVKFDESKSTYPSIPDYLSNRNDAIWYIDPKEEWGCWIINKSKQRFMVVNEGALTQGWAKNVYKSPYPVHNHNASLPLASKMAWYVDEDGYGQYVILVNGNFSMISSPRPKHWME
ncbi:hypothetical protein DZB84_20525 [Bacillus sp. HNG]|uniref:hypothetical protein n=1 Tax=Bacillus sp. HNG TaxID=2293325 RepID=UPI000E2FE68F|nr:hypothetical protein [Bacillus sp. HNG]RFB11455.1 hypothetical protein DZB84_20525 [Bacillus sp. HNG]